MTVNEQIDASAEYLGNGSYRMLSPVLTQSARDAGWIYQYGLGINRNGVKMVECGETLDSLLAQGFITLKFQIRTAF